MFMAVSVADVGVGIIEAPVQGMRGPVGRFGIGPL